MMKVFGIPNCDSVKKARQWLDKNKVAYQFHDLKTEPPVLPDIRKWIKAKGIDKVVNKNSTTWRNLTNQLKRELLSDKAAAVIKDHPTIIKRPVIESGKNITVGFDETEYRSLIKK